MERRLGPLPLSEGGRWVLTVFASAVVSVLAVRPATGLGFEASAALGAAFGLALAAASLLARRLRHPR